MAAAISAKEENPALDVTVVEKYSSGYSGKANRGAGVLLMLGDYTPEEFAAKIRKESTLVGSIVKRAGIQPTD